MTTWGFYSESGQELCAGWQGTYRQAAELAQSLANRMDVPVEYVEQDGWGYWADPEVAE